jgi:hypothetical protein
MVGTIQPLPASEPDQCLTVNLLRVAFQVLSSSMKISFHRLDKSTRRADEKDTGFQVVFDVQLEPASEALVTLITHQQLEDSDSLRGSDSERAWAPTGTVSPAPSHACQTAG